MNLRRFLLRKAAYVLLTVFFIAALNFFIFQILPGDPTRVLLPRGGTSQMGSETLRQELLHQWGLDQPLTTRFLIYLRNLFQGNFGTSITYRPGISAMDVIAPRLTTTLVLVGVATVLTMWMGVVLGRVSGWRRGRRTDVIITMTSLFGYSMPSFWVSLVLIFFLAVEVNVFPVHGETSLGYGTLDPVSQLLDRLYHLALPVLTFAITNVAWFSMTLRNSLTDVLPEDYMLTAAAKGLTEDQQLRRHALPNARLPVVTAAAIYFGWVVSGAIVIEVVFDFQGLGKLTWDATRALDFPLMSAIFFIATLGVVVANAISDILYMYLDPRVREA
ncbi:MAG: ABC transporter permease [Methanobacteriota archaeon]|nr:MAG: ABC transporter permease [Euryarchaeota archaeon]TMD03073.1 MAG: ABC transporter permease [Chloroflexota bacterium]